MSLRDEIERIIAAERQKLETRDRHHAEHHERQRHRFQPMRALLQEIAASVEPAYLDARFFDGSATLELGEKERGSTHTDIRWTIEPNDEFTSPSDESQSLFREKPGFRVEEKRYYRMPEYDIRETTHVFHTEAEAAEYLVREIAKEVAQYRHFASLRAQKQSRG